MEMASIITLPHEILHAIFIGVDVTDLASVCITCRALHQFISDNHILFKVLYLQRLDEPPQVKKGGDLDWEDELHKLTKLKRILDYEAVTQKRPHLKFVEEFVTSLTSTAESLNSKNVALLAKIFNDRANKEAFFCQSTLWTRARVTNRPLHLPGLAPCTTSFEDRQASAHLHCLYGVPILLPTRGTFYSSYPYACSIVYDLRNYTHGNYWGPFLEGRKAAVDWEKMEAVMLVLGYNLMMFTESTWGIFKPLWTDPFSGVSPDSFRSVPLSDSGIPSPPANALDPYNVSGSYTRVICFLDFQELYHYNFSVHPSSRTPLQPIETTEAIRFIIMELNVTDIQPPGEDDGQELPVVHFKGSSRLLDASSAPWTNTSSSIRGTVRLTKQGEVRWTTYSVYFGEERWKSEGIQIGGVGSARGVFGHWFDKNFSSEGPVGPSAFWKVDNAIGNIGSGLDGHMENEDDDDEDHDEEEEEEEMFGNGEDGESILGTVITLTF